MLSEEERQYRDTLEQHRRFNRSVEDDESFEEENNSYRHKSKKFGFGLLFFCVIVFFAFFFLKNINGQFAGDWGKIGGLWNNITTEVDKYKNEANSDWQKGEDLVNQAKQKKAEVEALKKSITDLTSGGSSSVNGNETAVNNNALPDWLKIMQADSTVENYLIPDFRCNYSGATVYLSLGGQPNCEDCYTDIVYKDDGQKLCNASGGLIGSGDGQCQDFFKKINDCYIWNGERWEVTKVGE